jgi:hypothetical protein
LNKLIALIAALAFAGTAFAQTPAPKGEAKGEAKVEQKGEKKTTAKATKKSAKKSEAKKADAAKAGPKTTEPAKK